MFIKCVYPAVAQQADEMHSRALLTRRSTGVQQRLIREKASILDSACDAHEVLHDDAACAEIHVADFAVSHLPVGQSNRSSRRSQQGTRRLRPQGVPIWRIGQRYRVGGRVLAVTPAVKNDQCNRSRNGS